MDPQAEAELLTPILDKLLEAKHDQMMERVHGLVPRLAANVGWRLLREWEPFILLEGLTAFSVRYGAVTLGDAMHLAIAAAARMPRALTAEMTNTGLLPSGSRPIFSSAGIWVPGSAA